MSRKTIKVLLIEDNPGDARLAQIRLSEAQTRGWDMPRFEVIWVDNLTDSLARLEAMTDVVEQFDAVLTDLDLPDSQAGETFATLRNHCPHLPIVVLTGREDEELARASVRAGAQDYLFKNEATGSLVAHALMYAIERQQAQQALQEAHNALEQRVTMRTAELAQANETLQTEIAAHQKTESKLQESVALLRATLEATADSIIVVAKDGQAVIYNHELEDLFDLPHEWLSEPSLAERMANVKPYLKNPDQAFARIGELYADLEIEDQGLLEFKDGRVYERYTAPYYIDGEIEGRIWTFRNITERKRAEWTLAERTRALQESESRLEAILKYTSAIIYLKDTQGRFMLVNPAFEEAFNITPDEILGKTSYDLVPAEMAKVHEQHDEQVIQTRKPIQFEEEGIQADGKKHTVISIKFPMLNSNGEIYGVGGISTDITDRKHAEQALEAQSRISQERESRVVRQLESILYPDGDLHALELADIIDVDVLQSLMDDFYSLTKIGFALVDLKGDVLVATGWQDICTQFHRQHSETSKYCLESDTVLSSGVESGTYKLYKCKNNMWDMATPMMVGDRHIGNLFLGQFFFDDETVDRELFRQQAQTYGFDEGAYLAALERVPRWSRDRVNTVFRFYTQLATQLSQLSHSNLLLAQSLVEREHFLEDYKASEQKFKSYIENAPYGVFVADQAGRYVEVNEAACTMTGYNRDELLSMRIIDLIPSGQQDVAEKHFQTVVEEAVSKGMIPFVRKNGVQRWWTVSAVKLSETRFLGYTEDVTARKQVEDSLVEQARALRESEALYRALFEKNLAIKLLIDPETGRIMDANPAALRFYGYSHAEICTLRITDINQLPDEQVYAAMGQTMRGQKNQFTFSHRIKSGEIRAVDVYSGPIVVHGRTLLYSIIHDVTERQRAVDALQDSEAELAAIIESSPFAMMVVDEEWRVRKIKRGATEFAGRLGEDILGLRCGDALCCIHAQDDPQGCGFGPECQTCPLRSLVLDTIRTRESHYEVEANMVFTLQESVEEKTLLVYATPLTVSGERQALVVLQDITARKRAEGALRESEERFRMTIQRSPIGVGMVDSEGNLSDCNAALAEMVGYSREELLALNFADFTHPDDLEREWQLINKLWGGHTTEYRMEKRYTHKDGHVIWVDVAASLFKDEQGELEFGFAFVQDITERKRFQKALQAEKERAQQYLDIAPVIILALNSNGDIILLNKAGSQVLECAQEEALEKNWFDTFLPERSREKAESIFAELLAGKIQGREEVEDIVLTARGHERIIHWQNSLLRGSEGHIVGALSSGQDVTKQKQAEEALYRYNERLQIQHDIDRAILSAQSADEIARAALTRLQDIIPYLHASITDVSIPQQRARDTVILNTTETLDIASSDWHPLSHVGPFIETLRQGQVRLVQDLTALASPSPLEQDLRANGARAYVSVPMFVQDKLVGTLNLASDSSNFFQPDHIEVFEGVAASLAVALQQAKLLAQAQQDAETRGLLLREVNHRVKNNLDAIIGLLYLERRHAPPEALPAYQPIMEDLIQRVMSLAQVHQLLSATEWEPLELSTLTERLIQSTVQTAPSEANILFDVQDSPVRVSPDQAHHLALIIGELTTNTLKYAGADADTIWVTVRISREGDIIKFTYHNTGPDYPEHVLCFERHGTGMDIIRQIARRNLQGQLTLRNDDGPVTEISFKALP